MKSLHKSSRPGPLWPDKHKQYSKYLEHGIFCFMRLPEVWERLHTQLEDGYLDTTHQNLAHCRDIAEEIGHALLADGGDPRIMLVGSCKWDGQNPEFLVPKPYEGKITWLTHYVCVQDGVVYDPMLAHPEPIDTYPSKAFGKEVKLTPLHPRPIP